MNFADIFVRFRTKSFVTNRALEETVRSQVYGFSISSASHNPPLCKTTNLYESK